MMPSCSSGEGTYGVSRSIDQASAGAPVMLALRVSQIDGLEAVAAKAARHEHHAIVRDRRRDRVHRHAGGLPDHAAGFEVVAAQLVHAGRDDLRAALVLDDERRGPGVDLVALHAPDLVAGRLVERDDERLALVVPDDDEVRPWSDRRRALAELVAHLLVAEILLPHQLAVHVVGVEPLRLERRDDVLAVGDRGARGEGAVVLMRAFAAAPPRARSVPRPTLPSSRSIAITT